MMGVGMRMRMGRLVLFCLLIWMWLVLARGVPCDGTEHKRFLLLGLFLSRRNALRGRMMTCAVGNGNSDRQVLALGQSSSIAVFIDLCHTDIAMK